MNHYALLSLWFPLWEPISRSLQLATAASKRHHSWDWSQLSEIYPAWSLGAQKGHRRSAHSQRILLGLVAWQHWLIGLAGLRKGLARAGGIRSFPLIISSLHSSESWGHGHKIKALPSCLREGYYAHRGAERGRLCVAAWSTIHSHKLSDCNWEPALEKVYRQAYNV